MILYCIDDIYKRLKEMTEKVGKKVEISVFH